MYDHILHHCYTEKPNLIYVAIGSALPYEMPTHNQLQQQLPDFVDDWKDAQLLDGVRKVCVLIDPALEYPPRICRDPYSAHSEYDMESCVIPTPLEPIPVDPYDRDILIFTMRREFHFTRSTDSDFLHALCNLCIREKGKVKLIVQDYSGRDIRPFYPTKTYGDWIHPYVLYDFTYRNSGCLVDFSTVEVLRFPGSGNFIQPFALPLHLLRLYTKRHSPILQHEIFRRTDAILNCLWYFYRVQIGTIEPTHWCTHQLVNDTLRSIVVPYELTMSLEPANIRVAMMLILQDVAQITGHPITRDELQQLFDTRHAEVVNTVIAIRSAEM